MCFVLIVLITLIEQFFKVVAYSGVEYSTECYCGYDYDKHGQLPESECNRPCPDEPERMCGGLWSLSVYRYVWEMT